MGKVSIALRGWRFDEDEIFTADGSMRPLEKLEDETRDRLVRLGSLIGDPCDACWLETEDRADSNTAQIVYGEPLSEVLLCVDHEPDFLYWYREAGGAALRGQSDFADSFHEWFTAGSRAPDGYGNDHHVDTDPDDIPQPRPDPDEVDELRDAIDDLDEEDVETLGMDYSEVT